MASPRKALADADRNRRPSPRDLPLPSYNLMGHMSSADPHRPHDKALTHPPPGVYHPPPPPPPPHHAYTAHSTHSSAHSATHYPYPPPPTRSPNRSPFSFNVAPQGHPRRKRTSTEAGFDQVPLRLPPLQTTSKENYPLLSLAPIIPDSSPPSPPGVLLKPSLGPKLPPPLAAAPVSAVSPPKQPFPSMQPTPPSVTPKPSTANHGSLAFILNKPEPPSPVASRPSTIPVTHPVAYPAAHPTVHPGTRPGTRPATPASSSTAPSTLAPAPPAIASGPPTATPTPMILKSHVFAAPGAGTILPPPLAPATLSGAAPTITSAAPHRPAKRPSRPSVKRSASINTSGTGGGGSYSSSSGGTSATEIPAVLNVEDIHIEGEECQAVPVYDTCDTVRHKIRHTLETAGVTQAAFLRELGKAYNPIRKLQSKSLNDFLSKKGPKAGNTSCIYYSAYVFFEKLRLRDGTEKGEDRLAMEGIFPAGVNTTEVRTTKNLLKVWKTSPGG